MTFPPITAKATNMTMTPELAALLDQKFLPLGKFVHERDDARCEIELERVAEHHSGRIYRAEVNFFNDGTLYRAEATREQIEQAIDDVRDELRHELQHVRGKKHSLLQRGRRALKNMLRFGE
jgi:ribosomal subunit interface protein